MKIFSEIGNRFWKRPSSKDGIPEVGEREILAPKMIQVGVFEYRGKSLLCEADYNAKGCTVKIITVPEDLLWRWNLAASQLSELQNEVATYPTSLRPRRATRKPRALQNDTRSPTEI